MGDQRPEDLHVAAPATPTTSGWRPAPIPTPPSTRASRSSSCRPPTPGSSYSKINTMVNASTFNTFYDDVRVRRRRHRRRRQPGLGPHRQPAQLRAGVARPARAWSSAVYERGACAGRRTRSCPTAGGSIDQEWVQLNLARVHAKLEFLKLINWKVAAAGGANPADASATKVFGTEFFTEAYRLLMEVLGPAAYLRRARRGAVARRPARARLPGHADPHLRRRRERGAARPHRPLRPRPAPGAPALRSDRWTSPSPTSSRRSPTWPTGSCPSSCPPERLRELEQTGAVVRRRRLGRAGQGRPARPRACPRPTAAAATASSRPA